MLDIEEFKRKVYSACERGASALPYDDGQLEAEDWQTLSEELRELASRVFRLGSSLAAYASNAQHRANNDWRSDNDY